MAKMCNIQRLHKSALRVAARSREIEVEVPGWLATFVAVFVAVFASLFLENRLEQWLVEKDIQQIHQSFNSTIKPLVEQKP